MKVRELIEMLMLRDADADVSFSGIRVWEEIEMVELQDNGEVIAQDYYII